MNYVKTSVYKPVQTIIDNLLDISIFWNSFTHPFVQITEDSRVRLEQTVIDPAQPEQRFGSIYQFPRKSGYGVRKRVSGIMEYRR